jgi:hypothetical protein
MAYRRWIAFALVIGLLGLSFHPTVAAQAVLGEILITGNATINQVKATSGSTFFSGSEIQTFDRASAIINLSHGGGVLSLEPGSRVKITGDREITAEVYHGTITLRTTQASRVRTPQAMIESEADNAYLVTVSTDGTIVEPMRHRVVVQANGQQVVVNPGERGVAQQGQVKTDQTQQPQEKGKEGNKRRQKTLLILIPLILGAIIVPVAMNVASGEKSPAISPTTPRP